MIGLIVTALVFTLIFGGLAWAFRAKSQAKTYRILAFVLGLGTLVLVVLFFLTDGYQSP